MIGKLGFGTWQIGGPTLSGGRQTGWGRADEAEALAALHGAAAAGIRFFDTAPAYGWGRAEELLGRALPEAEARDVLVCTKFGQIRRDDGSVVQDFSAQALLREIDSSLRRLRREKLDVLLLHSPPDDFDWADYDTEPFERLRRQGKISRFGVSARTVRGALRAVEQGFGQVIEAIFNILDRRAEELLLPLCAEKNLLFVARVPLASGFLASRNIAREFPADDIRHDMAPEQRAWCEAAVNKLGFLSDLPGGLLASALRYLLANPAVSFVIPGMRRVDQVGAALAAAKLGPLPDKVAAQIRMALPETCPAWTRA
jgi:myo-inositol catabolism protein IolS